MSVQIGDEILAAGQVYSHRRRGVESASFAYDEVYLADRRAYSLDPALPLRAGLQQKPGRAPIFGAFSDSCATDGGKRLIERAESHRATDTHTLDRDPAHAVKSINLQFQHALFGSRGTEVQVWMYPRAKVPSKDAVADEVSEQFQICYHPPTHRSN